MTELSLEPIGFLRAEQQRKYQLDPQPAETKVSGTVVLETGKNFEVALRDLEGFDRIWLLWWFHKNDNWRPTTLPPRGRTGRKGTFATRSPYRPNPLAMSCVELLGVERNLVRIGAHDLLDGTPILDIKPYMPEFDSFPHSNSGWFGKMERELAETETYEVILSPEVEAELDSRRDLKKKILDLLSIDPKPHRTRRIVPYHDAYRLSCGDWRVLFSIKGKTVKVDSLALREQ